MSEEENFHLDDIISGEKKIEYVDKLELLREKLNSRNVLNTRSNKKELIDIVENLIDLMPVELRTARWLVREQDTYLNRAREEANEILNIAKVESQRLISDSYVLQEAVIEANAMVKKAEDEAQANRAHIEDQIDSKLTEILNKFEQVNKYIETEKNNLRQPRKIIEPE
jgi:vacuolar-type H+-ATPase subunit H|tara:strand:- start:119 stop:625 length:507 start_codon:yes stop_codon:yes gene_type:complete